MSFSSEQLPDLLLAMWRFGHRPIVVPQLALHTLGWSKTAGDNEPRSGR
jgi:hypothetical protein